MDLFDPAGHRLYLAADERVAFLEAAKPAPREVRTFCHVLHDRGCRLSEALALPMRGVDLAGKVVVLETLPAPPRVTAFAHIATAQSWAPVTALVDPS